MVQPNTRQEQHDIEFFIPDQKIFVGIGFSCYDAVWKIQQGKKGAKTVMQALADVTKAWQNCVKMKNLLERYDFDFTNEENIYLLKDPTKAEAD